MIWQDVLLNVANEIVHWVSMSSPAYWSDLCGDPRSVALQQEYRDGTKDMRNIRRTYRTQLYLYNNKNRINEILTRINSIQGNEKNETIQMSTEENSSQAYHGLLTASVYEERARCIYSINK